MKKAIKIFNKFYDLIGLIFLIGLIVCCLLQVLSRFIDSLTIVWTDELAGYMMVGCCFIGSGTAMRFGGHLGAYFLRDRVKGRACGVLLLFNALVMLVIFAVFIYGAMLELKLVGSNVAVSMPWLSQKWLYIPLIIGSIYMGLYTVRDAAVAVRIIQTGNTDGFRTGFSSPFPAEE